MKLLSEKGNVFEFKGNLITSAEAGKVDIIVHGCNCFATMAAGIAASIASSFPEAKKADKAWKTKTHKERLGHFTEAKIAVKNDKELIVVNAYTQYSPGPDFKMHALKNFLKEIVEKYGNEEKPKIIGLPKIGCGIAGGDWNEVKPVIESALAKNFIVYFFYID
jgi:O-acetyl-ADP-ribose deacetylase (regulator of RNase III)